MLALVFAPPALAGGGPENVAVVVNRDSWASSAVANEFAALRNIPPDNIIILDDVPSFEIITVDQFRDDLLQPIIDALTARGLDHQIDIIAWSCDFPWAIDVRSGLAGADIPQVATPTASLNGLTYLYQHVLAKSPTYLGMGSNLYYRRTNNPNDESSWTPEEQREYQRALEILQQRQNLEEAERILAQAAATHSGAAAAWYNYACALAVQNKTEPAVDALRRAVAAGWNDAVHTRSDEDLASLRALPEFNTLLDEMAVERVFTVAPSLGFRHEYGFGRDGAITDPRQGAHYLLSTMLAVTSGRGLSVQEALDSIARSAAADGTRPPGTFYYMRNGDVRARTRMWGFPTAASLLRQLGHNVEILEGDIPRGRDDILGLMSGIAAFDFAQSGSAILPGALCEHLTSFGGIMREGGGQTPLTEFIRHGAAGASGTVHEPYSIQAKFPDPMMHVHYARGCSLAESFYQSVAGPYQLLIVGDPLCAPWATPPRLALRGPKPGEKVRGVVDIEPMILDGQPIKQIDLFVDGRLVGRFPSAETTHIETNLLSDGWHELRYVAVVADAIESQGRAILPLVIDNNGRSVKFAVTRREVDFDHTLSLRAESTGAERIEIHHSGRIIATIEGERGSVDIAASTLGLGFSIIQAHAVFHEGPAAGENPDLRATLGPANIVRSEPIEVHINPAALVSPGGPGTMNRQLLNGLRVTSQTGVETTVNETRDRDWLADAGVRHNEWVTIEGWVRAEEDGLHQLQLRSPREIALEINDKAVALDPTADWQYLPLHLARGLHHVKFTLRGEGPPQLDARFGLRGAQSLDGRRFRHVP